MPQQNGQSAIDKGFMEQTLRGCFRVDALVDRAAPNVTRIPVALPPHALTRCARNRGREEAPVLGRMPLRGNLGTLRGERVGDGNALVLAKGTAEKLAILVDDIPNAVLPLVIYALRTFPPHFAK